jgi:hypothetical protein
MVIAVVGEAVHEISKDRKRRSAEKTFDKQMSLEQRWIVVFRKECSVKTDKQPQIRILQIAANSINLPDYELVSKADDFQHYGWNCSLNKRQMRFGINRLV